MSYATIQNLLVNRVKALSGLPPVQGENERNIGQTGQSFCRVTLLPARPRQLTVGKTGRDVWSGLLQCDIFVPQDTGVAQANALADSLIEHFPRGLVLTQGNVNVHIRVAYRETGARIQPFYSTPVVVQWESIV